MKSPIRPAGGLQESFAQSGTPRAPAKACHQCGMNKECFNLFVSLILGIGLLVERTKQTLQVRDCSLDKRLLLTGVMKPP